MCCHATAVRSLLSKREHGIFNVCNDFSACSEHDGETGTDESVSFTLSRAGLGPTVGHSLGHEFNALNHWAATAPIAEHFSFVILFLITNVCKSDILQGEKVSLRSSYIHIIYIHTIKLTLNLVIWFVLFPYLAALKLRADDCFALHSCTTWHIRASCK